MAMEEISYVFLFYIFLGIWKDLLQISVSLVVDMIRIQRENQFNNFVHFQCTKIIFSLELSVDNLISLFSEESIFVWQEVMSFLFLLVKQSPFF